MCSLNIKTCDIARVFVGGVFVYAALQKALSIPMFAFVLHEVIQSGTWISSNTLIGLSIAIVLIESFLGFSLVLRYQAAKTIPASLLVLVVFTLVLLALVVRKEPIRCGCLGVPVGAVGTRGELMLGIVWNVILAGFLAMDLRATRKSLERVPSVSIPRYAPSRSRGFTLVELLVSIGVIVVVLSITLPALMGARNSGIVAKSLSGHRHTYAYFDMFTNDHADQFPFPYIRRDGDYADPTYSASDRPSEGYTPAPMTLQARVWASLFLEQDPEIKALVYQGRWSTIVGRDVPAGLIGGSFVASSTMFALPEYFASDPNQAVPSLLRPTRTPLVTYPSSKVLTEDLESWGRVSAGEIQERSATFGFADGSADSMSVSQFSGDWVSRPSAWMSSHGHTTLDGLSGRDR